MAKKKKRKIKTKNLVILIVIVTGILLGVAFMTDIKINNVIVEGNVIYNDYEIIEKAGLSDYPSSLKNASIFIKKNLEKDIYIKKAQVYKPWIDKVVIKVEENFPLFYYLPTKKTILKDKSKTDDNFPVPTVINYIPDKVYESFLTKISNVPFKSAKDKFLMLIMIL